MISTTSTFSESDKFNSTNWTSWQRLIRTMAMSKEVFGYLNRSIKQPPSLPADKASPAKTPWDSETSSPKKWRAHDAWTLGLLLINTKNPAGLGINIDETAAEAWTSYINTYKKAFNMTRLSTEQILWNAMYSNRTNFTVSGRMPELWSQKLLMKISRI